MAEEKLIRRENYFAVLAYLNYFSEIMQREQKTIKRKWAHLLHLLNWAGDVPFETVHKQKPIFPQYLLTARNDKSEEVLSASSMTKACSEARAFFNWIKLSRPSKYKYLKPLWIESLRPARANSLDAEYIERRYYRLEDVRKLVSVEPQRLIDRRDRAAVAMLFLSGMRISAFVTLPIYCVDLENKSIDQFPSEGVKTKNSKAARTFLIPIDDLFEIVREWDEFVRTELGIDAFWYPNLTTDGMDWLPNQKTGNSDSRRISFSKSLRRFCKLAKIPYLSPHKLRNGHGVYVVKQAEDIEEFKAYSQNMMHGTMEITDRLYGRLDGDDIKAVVTGKKEKTENDKHLLFQDFMSWLEDGN